MTEEKQITFPHCDPRILHPPGTCKYCDESGLQEVREAWNIAYTGQPEEGKTPCPGEAARGLDNLNRWGGNQAQPSLHSMVRHLQRLNRHKNIDGGS
jgi:hypothetical protein